VRDLSRDKKVVLLTLGGFPPYYNIEVLLPMAKYAVRVQLMGNPTADEYETLHTVMANYGFNRTVDGVNTKNEATTFTLPHGLYYGLSNAAISDVRDAIVADVKAQVQQDIRVFVMDVNTWSYGW
jgi:hypothetical protein